MDTLTWLHYITYLCYKPPLAYIDTNKTHSVSKQAEINLALFLFYNYCDHFDQDPGCIKMHLCVKASPVVIINSPITEQPEFLSKRCLINCEISCSHNGISFLFQEKTISEPSKRDRSISRFANTVPWTGDKSLLGNKSRSIKNACKQTTL